MSMTPRLEDFITPPRPVNISSIKGIVGSLQPLGIGTVRYIITDDTENDIQVFIPDMLYCPTIPLPLISPQCLCKSHGQTQTSRFTMTANEYYLHIQDRCVTIPYSRCGYKNLPTIKVNTTTDQYDNQIVWTGDDPPLR